VCGLSGLPSSNCPIAEGTNHEQDEEAEPPALFGSRPAGPCPLVFFGINFFNTDVFPRIDVHRSHDRKLNTFDINTLGCLGTPFMRDQPSVGNSHTQEGSLEGEVVPSR